MRDLGRSSFLVDREDRPSGIIVGSVMCLVVLAIAGAVGLAIKQPWLFPSLGPSVTMFFATPTQKGAHPLNSVIGHSVGIAAGYLCYVALGLVGSPSAPTEGLTVQYVIAGALSVAITTLVLHLIRIQHPPASATTLIVSLDILSTPLQMLDIFGAVVLISLASWLVHAIGRGTVKA